VNDQPTDEGDTRVGPEGTLRSRIAKQASDNGHPETAADRGEEQELSPSDMVDTSRAGQSSDE